MKIRPSYWGSFARDGNPNVQFAPTWPRYAPQGDLPQFATPSARRVADTKIGETHNCSVWDAVSPAV